MFAKHFRGGAWTLERWAQLVLKNWSRPLPFAIGILWGHGDYVGAAVLWFAYMAATGGADLLYWVGTDQALQATRHRIQGGGPGA